MIHVVFTHFGFDLLEKAVSKGNSPGHVVLEVARLFEGVLLGKNFVEETIFVCAWLKTVRLTGKNVAYRTAVLKGF